MLETPVLLIIFNRLKTTITVFEQIRKVKPVRFFIYADGPRSGIPEEKEKCNRVRKWVIDNIDWDCKINTLFRNENLGCGKAVSEAITWFFDNDEEGIILEDDCLPNESFFLFCHELLSYYRDNESIMMISGNNFQHGIKRGKGDYYFSAYSHIWGWASWKRAWDKYDFELKMIDEEKVEHILKRNFLTQTQRDFWLRNFYSVKYDKIDTWDYQWSFSILAADGLTILPNINLVSNIGFGENATHTITENYRLSNLDTASINFPLIHPKKNKLNKKADKYSFYKVINPQTKSIKKQFLRVLAKIMRLNSQIKTKST